MRLTLRLDDDLYAAARALARAEELSISEAVNRLLRRALTPRPAASSVDKKTGLPVVACRRPFGADAVARVEQEA